MDIYPFDIHYSGKTKEASTLEQRHRAQGKNVGL